MRKALLLCAVVGMASLGLVACGSSSSSSDTSASTTTTPPATTPAAGGGGGGGGGGASSVDLAADPSQLKYDTSSLSATAGKVTINFDNPSAIGHDVVISDSSGKELAKTDVVSQGKANATADLKPGTYTFFCSVDGHRQAGMEGTLTVK